MRWSSAIFLLASIVAMQEVAIGGSGPMIDLRNFGGVEPAWSPADEVPLEEVGYFGTVPNRRFYVSGIVGASFASLTTGGGADTNLGWFPLSYAGTVNDSLFTAGGAAGIAWDRPSGALRLEFEGRGREAQDGVGIVNTTVPPFTVPTWTSQVRASDGWSTMANIWRDWSLAERFSMYVGGGIGAGGYRLTVFEQEPGQDTFVTGSSVAGAFAWQAGGGFFYHLSDRIVIDLGYRFFSISSMDTPLQIQRNGPTRDYGTFTSAFSASELLLSVRFYEPFRRWR